MRCFLRPKNVGKIENADAVGELKNDGCGDVMKVYLKIAKKGKQEYIKNIKFQTLGCPAAIASSDALCTLAKGKNLKQALAITDKAIVKKLGGLPSIKLHCSVLGQKTLKDAIDKYQSKNKEVNNMACGCCGVKKKVKKKKK